MKKKSRNKTYIKKLVAIFGGITLLAIITGIFFQHVNHTSHTLSYVPKCDMKWPYKDLTYGNYSGNYDGIDISHHQGLIHWDELKSNKHIKFIYIKATGGYLQKDPCYERNISEAQRHGFLVGSYHFLSKNAKGNIQFDHFNNVVNKGRQDLRPLIDCEDDGTKGWSKKEIQKNLNDFINACIEEYGIAPIIYCSESYYKDYLYPTFNKYTLFIASYDEKPMLPGKRKYDIWQHCRHGRIPGIWNWVDLDKFGDNMTVENIKL